MLSKKMTFSLTSLITIFALAFMVSSAMAGPFEIKIMGPTTANYATESDGSLDTDGPVTVMLTVMSGQPIADLAYTPGTSPTATDDITVHAFNSDGFSVALSAANVTVVDQPITAYAMKTPKQHQLLVTITPTEVGGAPDIARVIISIKGGRASSDPTLAAADSKSKADVVRHTITLRTAPTAAELASIPKVVSIQRLRPGSQTVVAAFQEEKITTDPFNVRIVLTGRPHKDDGEIRHLEIGNIDVENGTASNLVVGIPFARHGQGDAGAALTGGAVAAADDTLRPHPIEGMYEHAGDGALTGVPVGVAGSGNVPMPTGTGNSMYHQYRVTITPHQKSADFTIKIKVKNFHDGASPIRNSYVSPGFGESGNLPNGREILSINVKGAARDLTAGYKVTIPKDWIIPANGYLIIAKSKANSQIDTSGQDADRTNDTPRATHRTPAQLLYNVYQTGDLPNLATQFLNGVVVDVVSQHPGLVVSEVMWGEDVSLIDRTSNQWIELYNPGDQYKTINDKDETPDVNEALTLIFYRPNEFSDVPAVGADGSLPAGVTDRVGTLDTAGAYWSPATKGQNGASGIANVQAGGDLERTVAPSAIIPVVSMYRVMAADGTIDAMMGQMAASWASSQGPKSANFHPLALGLRHGTPGAKTDAIRTPADDAADAAKAAAEAAAAEAAKINVAMGSDIKITEIMVNTDSGRLPQWIELTSVAAGEVSLDGWSMVIDNAIDEKVLGKGNAITVSLSGITLDVSAHEGNLGQGQSALVTAWAAPRMSDNIRTERVINVGAQLGQTRRYQLLSYDGFRITLVPPQTGAIADFGNVAGNLHEDWKFEMDGRSSFIRVEKDTAGMMMTGTDENGWKLASATDLIVGQPSYYGDDEDNSTPGHDAGGPLPVELSHFRPARDKATGAVVITWATQSELNNAGFFIKRSNQRDGDFTVINATMVPGAGTTSEKQTYTYTDTTAQPNIVYYYQIEDVSLDGNRQTLTLGTRLKGHIGAAGKLTSMWGELKSSNE